MLLLSGYVLLPGGLLPGPPWDLSVSGAVPPHPSPFTGPPLAFAGLVLCFCGLLGFAARMSASVFPRFGAECGLCWHGTSYLLLLLRFSRGSLSLIVCPLVGRLSCLSLGCVCALGEAWLVRGFVDFHPLLGLSGG